MLISEQQKSLYWLYNIYITESLCSMFVFFTSCDSSSLLCCIFMFLQLVWSFRTNSLKTHFHTIPSFFILIIFRTVYEYTTAESCHFSLLLSKIPTKVSFSSHFCICLANSKIEIVHITTILWHFHLKLLTETVVSFVNNYTVQINLY